MTEKAMSLKARIRNFARKKQISPQVVLQNYLFERFLERLSKSEYQEKFILKGGMLIASLVGIDNRSTMDMDATIRNYPINIDSLIKAIEEICEISVDDDISFSISGIEAIRDDDAYGGYRVGIISIYDTIVTPMQIDITTGDVITPKEIQYLYKMLFDEGVIGIWAYNIETILAEKVETILRRGELNTRPRDFYDIYILFKTQSFDDRVFADALKSTAKHRGTTYILRDISKRIKVIKASETLKLRWIKYTNDYRYADGITFKDVIDAISELTSNIS